MDRAVKALFATAVLSFLAAVLLHVLPYPPATPQPPQNTAESRVFPVADAPSAPVRLRIPRLRLTADVLPLALDVTGALDVPGFRDAMKVGWYALGPSPGTPGPAVLVGHRDRPASLYADGKLLHREHVRNAVFAKLGRLIPGDRVETELGDGRRLSFTVSAVDTYPTGLFPTERVYGPVPDPQLRLITCGGVIDSTGHWDSNVVVSAVTSPLPASH